MNFKLMRKNDFKNLRSHVLIESLLQKLLYLHSKYKFKKKTNDIPGRY